MQIKRLDIEGFRSFAQAGRLDLALPTGKRGSGITAVVGPNNAGKSTVIEALSMFRLSQPTFSEGKRNKQAGDRISIKSTTINDQQYELRTVDSGGSETIWTPSFGYQNPFSLFYLPSRRAFSPYFSRSETTRQQYMSNFATSQFRSATVDNFYQRLFTAQQNRTEFDRVLSRVLYPVPDWKIDQTDQGMYYIKIQSGNAFHNSDGLGEGLVSLLFIVDALYDSSPNDIIVIDEPELSLHPSLQFKLFQLLADYATERQIVYATHSPYFVDWSAIFEGAVVVRAHKHVDEQYTVLSSLSQQSVNGLKGLIHNLNNPHVLGLDAREVFFLEDRVILVEGQEDVVFYRRIAEQIGEQMKGTFFGWGVGGAENMQLIASVLENLGFDRVVGVLDANKESLRTNLATMFPRYRFFTIPADDVRTKEPVSAREGVEGLADSGGPGLLQSRGGGTE